MTRGDERGGKLDSAGLDYSRLEALAALVVVSVASEAVLEGLPFRALLWPAESREKAAVQSHVLPRKLRMGCAAKKSRFLAVAVGAGAAEASATVCALAASFAALAPTPCSQ